MSEFSVDPTAVRQFATEHATIAGQITAAADMDLIGQVSALTPVFGLIGADYLASFAAAQVLQAKDIHDLAGKYNDLSWKAFSAASLFEETDGENAAQMNTQASGI
ncbi:ESX-1 secretion-associated protein [Nocardia higoensis]|nr:ESX-1 secretion-associated protein [Nocardia higoensis]